MIDSKVKCVLECPTPKTIKELQHFLGFTNFYCQFIHNFSVIASPLTSLMEKGSKKLQWVLSAEDAFNRLKAAFISAPIL